jgi:hypothetical protein
MQCHAGECLGNDVMEYKSNTKEVLARLALIRANIAAGTFSDALVAGLNAGMGVMKRRIFNQSLDAEGVTLGPYYSEQYERDRQRAGRQVGRKDLEMQGSLRRSIEVIAVNNTAAEIRITNQNDADKARFQEQQIFNLRNGLPANTESGQFVPIFELTAEEWDIVKTTTRALLLQKFNF